MNRNKAGMHIRSSGGVDLNTASINDFLIKDDDKDASDRFTCTAWKLVRIRLLINLQGLY